MKTLDVSYIIRNGEEPRYEEELSLFIEKSNKAKNRWWRTLTLFTDATLKSHLDFFKQRVKKFYETGSRTLDSQATAKTCPAIGKGLLDKVFLVKAPCDIYIYSKGLITDIEVQSKEDLNISYHGRDQFIADDNLLFDKYINIKFELPLYTRTSGVSYIFLDPQYHNIDAPYKVSNGIIEGKFTKGQPLNINTLWRVEEEEKTTLIKQGDVLAYLLPFEDLKLNYTQTFKNDSRGFFNRYK